MKRSLPAFAVALVLLAASSVAYAGDEVTSLSYISYLERYATLQPQQTGETLDVVVNMPVLAGDRLTTSRGARVEVQLADGSTVWVDEFSTVDFDSLAFSRDDSSARSALYLAEGTAAVEIPTTALGDGTMRLDSPAGTVYLNRPGLYRLALRGNEIRIQAFSGLAELPVGVGSALLRGGEEATVLASGEVEKAGISDRTDDFWNWVQERRNPTSGPTAQYVNTQAAGRTAVLDSYGDWVYVDTFSNWMWRPRVSLTWAPYSYGRWYWTPVGYSWISYEPWGWYPFHYGSWYLDASFGWVWGWDSVWSPAWVYWMYSPGYVGWCPRGYYDWWYYHNCSHCWGNTWMHPPARWSEVAFNFSGRVRLADVDPRPWTVVPAGQFGNTHLERVRLDSGRFLRDVAGDRSGVVRTGPLVTSVPSRGLTDRGIDSFFRLGADQREVPDLSSVLGRENVSRTRTTAGSPLIRPTLTRDIQVGQRVPVTDPTTSGGAGTGAAGWNRVGGTTRGVGVETPAGRAVERPEVQRGRVGTGTSTQPPVERRPVERVRTQDTPSSQPRDAVRPPSRDVDSKRGSAPTERPQPPPATERAPATSPAERPPTQARGAGDAASDWVTRTRERLWSRAETERQAPSARASTSVPQRQVPVRNAIPARPVVSQPTSQPRTVEVRQVAAPRESVRAVPISRAPVAVAHSAPAQRITSSVSAAPHTAAPRAAAPQSAGSRGTVSHGGASRSVSSHAGASSGGPH
jgi:Family of unknown function (DUF6600)/FecR protein